jgi:predicted PurR-regulated permease PerM
MLLSLLGGWHVWQLVGVVVAYTAIQTLEGFVITPRIVGKTVGLSEIWVLVALFVGGQIFGFLGVLLAVPAAAVAKIFVVRAVQHYRTTALFLNAPPVTDLDRNPARPEGDTHGSPGSPDQGLVTPPRRRPGES